MTRCKFTCTGVTKRANNWNRGEANSPEFLYEAEFSVVTSGSPENDSFFKWTPSGSVKIAVYKDDVFQPGKSYFFDISEAE